MSLPHRAPQPSPDEEERTPSPAPVQLSKEGTLRVQRLDRMLQLLRPQTDVGLDLDVPLLPPQAGIVTPILTSPTATATSSFSSSQKGFLAYDGCSEHNFLLHSMLTDSRRQKRNLLLVWLDIREAFPSVSHNLMLSMMERHGLSGTLLRVVQDVYSNATISVRTGKDSYTASIPQRRGVKQGCPLSPILFNIALEGLLRHLTTSQAGYLIGTNKVNALAYADDVCAAASSKEEAQSLLDSCAAFGDWAGFRFNARKCGSLCLANQTPHIYVDDLFTPRLGDEVIPALTWGDRYRYLGCPTGAYRTKERDLNTIHDTLVKDTTTIFMSPLAE